MVAQTGLASVASLATLAWVVLLVLLASPGCQSQVAETDAYINDEADAVFAEIDQVQQAITDELLLLNGGG